MASIEEKIEQLIVGKVEELGYELYDVQYVKEGKDYFLRIFIDKQDGIGLNDCEKVSNEINEIIDKADYIKEQYFLEISSTGIEKVLRKDKHLEKNIGKEIEIKLFKPIENSKEYIGILKNFDNQNVTIENEEKNNVIPRNNIALIKIHYNWN